MKNGRVGDFLLFFAVPIFGHSHLDLFGSMGKKFVRTTNGIREENLENLSLS